MQRVQPRLEQAQREVAELRETAQREMTELRETAQREVIELREAAAFHRVVGAVERGVAAGALPSTLDPFEAALELWAVAHGTASLLIGTPGFPWPEDFVDRVLGTYLEGLQGR